MSVNEPSSDATDKDMNEFVSIQVQTILPVFFHFNVTTMWANIIHRHLGWVDHTLLALLNH